MVTWKRQETPGKEQGASCDTPTALPGDGACPPPVLFSVFGTGAPTLRCQFLTPPPPPVHFSHPSNLVQLSPFL